MTDGLPLAVAVIVGSPRRRSFNRSLVQALEELKPAGMRLGEVPIGDLPPHNEAVARIYERIGWRRAASGDLLPDIEGVERPNQRASVIHFRQSIKEADALLVITFEHHAAISGILRNAFAWATPVVGEDVLYGKPVASMGSLVGRAGTTQPPLYLRELLGSHGAIPLPKPEAITTFMKDKFNSAGNLIDTVTRDQIRTQLIAFETWTRTLIRR